MISKASLSSTSSHHTSVAVNCKSMFVEELSCSPKFMGYINKEEGELKAENVITEHTLHKNEFAF